MKGIAEPTDSGRLDFTVNLSHAIRETISAFDDGTRSRFFLIGNSAMFTSETILNRTYSGELLLQVLRQIPPSSEKEPLILICYAFSSFSSFVR